MTCFEPFLGRRKNGSSTLADDLQKYLKNVELKIIKLPVIWGIIEKKILQNIKDWKPDLLIGLGERSKSYIAFETLARNVRKEKDEAGRYPKHPFIEKNGDQTVRSTLVFKWTNTLDCPMPILISQDAGHYLCNDLFYQLITAKIGKTGFLHLPPQGETKEELYCKQFRGFVSAVIEQNL